MDNFRNPYNLGWGDHPDFQWALPNQQNQGPLPQAHHQALQGSNGNHGYWPHNQGGFPPYFQPHNQGQYKPNHLPRPPKCLEEMMEDLITSQQLMQRNFRANNDVVHELQDAQQEQMISLDHLARQMAQLATSINDMRESGGGILAQVQPPRKETLNQRSRMLSAAHCPSQVIVQVEDTEDSDKEIDEYVVVSPGEPAPIPLNPEADLSCVEVNIPYMEALKLPKASKVSKDCIAEASKGNGEIVVGGNVSSIIQNHLPSKCKDLDFREAKFLQDEYPTLFIEEKAELEAFSQIDLFNT